MSDAPQSRRARRTSEEEAADLAAAQQPTAGQLGQPLAASTEAEALSRRDRRRLERISHPLEAWTAEEEMIATGQIPVMTPERIAEHERISREKAAQAAREAAAASQEFKMVTPGQIQVPTLAEPASIEFPGAPAAAPAPAPAPVPASNPAAVGSYQPRMELDDDFPTGGPTPTATPTLAAPTELARPPMVRELFPPGESQTALRQQDPFPVAPTDTAPAVRSGQIPTLLPPQEVPDRPVNPVEEIRRLAAEAMSGIEKASKADEAATAAALAAATAPEAAAEFGALAGGAAPAQPYGAPQQQPGPQQPEPHQPYAAQPQPQQAPQNRYEAPAQGQESPSFDSLGVLPSANTPQAGAGSSNAMFDELARANSGAIPRAAVDPRQGGAQSGQFPSPYGAPASGQFPMPGQGQQGGAQSGQFPSPYGAPASGQFPSPYGAPASGQFPMPGQGQQGGVQSGQFPSPYGAPASGQFPLPGQGQQGGVQSGQFPSPYGAPASGQFPMPGQQPQQQAPQQAPAQAGGPAWGAQPVTGAQRTVGDPTNFTPVANVPTPDFSAFRAQQTGTFPAVGGFNTTDPTATGQLAAIRAPYQPEVGGVKHFKWLHLAVIGALMFVLGVVIYNVAFAK